MDRLARNLDDLRRIVSELTKKKVKINFKKENLIFTDDSSPIANLMLSIMGAFSEFEGTLIRERQLEGIALAKQRGAYKGRKTALSSQQIQETQEPSGSGDVKSQIARDLKISRETLYQYLNK